VLKFILKRLVSLVPVLAVVAVVVFLLMHITPGDAAAVMLGPEATPQDVDALREQLGLNDPLYVQFFSWLGGILTGDLGSSPFLGESVAEALWSHLGPTLSLAILAQAFAILVAIPAGIIAAKRRGSLLDQGFMGLTILGVSVPSFLLGLFLILAFSVGLRWLPVAGYQPLSAGLGEHLRYLILPAIALGSMQAALIARMTRSSMLDVLSTNYLKTGKAKGLGSFSLTFKHAFKNAALPVLTVVGQTFGSLVAGAAVVETVFNIPGIGQLIINSVDRRDLLVIQGAVLLIAVSYVLINLVVDILYGLLDPRVQVR
jgi:peptide/nickel transport system permease protein